MSAQVQKANKHREQTINKSKTPKQVLGEVPVQEDAKVKVTKVPEDKVERSVPNEVEDLEVPVQVNFTPLMQSPSTSQSTSP